MLFASVILLTVYFIWDTLAYRKEKKADIARDIKNAVPFSIEGQVNFVWLFGVILAVAFLNSNYIPQIKETPSLGFIREAVLVVLIIASKLTTKEEFRKFNNFTLHPIQEVAYLFIGIFITMIPALVLLEAHGKELGITERWHFFWATGIFSSVLDNAPTYLTFGSLASGILTPPGSEALTLGQFIGNVQAEEILKAISVGAVFMGAILILEMHLTLWLSQ